LKPIEAVNIGSTQVLSDALANLKQALDDQS
jgi:hypothetical protein